MTEFRAPLAISVKGLTKRYGRTAALRGVDLELAEGERLALFGPNGSGKTTLLKVLAGLLRPTRGAVTILGMDWRRAGNAVRQRLGVVSHHTYLYEDLTGEENLLFYGRMFGVEDLAFRVDQALERAVLTKRRKDKVRTFSRGMQQRLALARATLHDPDVLLLDEPDTGLDQEASSHIGLFLEREHGRRRSVLMATHNLPLGSAHCDRFAVLAQGRVVLQGSPGSVGAASLEELYRTHVSQ